MNPWKDALEILQTRGWNCKLLETDGPALDKQLTLVQISRNGVYYSAQAPSADEAVGSAYGFANEFDRGQIQILQ